VRVVSLRLRDFRSYAHAHAQLGVGLTVVHGANGAGKSNLLEALYFGCTAHSPRTRTERELVRFGARTARVAVTLDDDGRPRELSVAYEASAQGAPARKRMTADGAPVGRLLDVANRPLLGVFQPDRLELVKGPPSVRRAHLDQVVAALWPARVGVRLQFARALAQRNALLARIRAGMASPATLSTWDRELAGCAVRLRADREEAVALLAEPFALRAAQLGCPGAATLEYRPRSRALFEDELVHELAARRELDLRRGFSGHGPHRDDLAILRDGRELRQYGSQGEQRLALLALLLCERSVITRMRDRAPLMLLDDVMSELDPDRRELLARELRGDGQSVIATTDLAQVPGSASSEVARLAISGGAILQEARAA
jgi:DNA replication and repair protein RecF